MGRKPKQPGAKAKSKAKVAPKATKSQATPKRPPPEPDQAADEASRKRVQLGRRDTDQQVERAMLTKLNHFPKSLISAKRNKQGQSIREVISNEVRRRRTDGGKLGARFWSQLFEAFDLSETVAYTLPEPEDNELPSSELLDVLSAAHNANPVKACVTPLERFLDHAPSLSATSTYGLLRAVMVCPTLPLHHAMKAQVAVLRFWARTTWGIQCSCRRWPFVLCSCSCRCGPFFLISFLAGLATT